VPQLVRAISVNSGKYLFNIGLRGCSLLELSFILPSSSEFLYVRAQ
jgi:hypothetical protein